MATIAVAAVGAYLGPTFVGGSAVLTAAVVSAAAIGATYIDSKIVYPKLFPTDDPQQPTVTGIDTMTGQDGSPGHTSWGRFALVGGHVLWFENLETTENQLTSKKGGGATVTKRVADIGIGLTSNLITSVEQLFADQKVLWRRDPNNVLWADYRATIITATFGTPGIAGAAIGIIPTIGSVQDVGQVFRVGDVVLMSGNLDATQNGYWRVRDMRAMGDASYPFGGVWLQPLGGQTPTVAIPGTAAAPMQLRRIDAGIVDYTKVWGIDSGSTKLSIRMLGRPYPASGEPSIGLVNQDSHLWRRLSDVIVTGQIVRLENFSNGVNGRWIVDSVFRSNYPGTGEWQDSISIKPRDGQAVVLPTHISSTNVGRVVVEGDEGFLDPKYIDLPVAQQSLLQYLGTEDQGPDPDLEAVYGAGNVHGYRGLARVTLRKLNLSNWGDRVPQISAAVRMSDHQTTHDVIRYLMREAFRGDDSWYDLTQLEADQLLGYTRRGQQSTSTTLQPLAIAYGIEAQERGPTWAFFKGKDADLHVLAESDLGAYVGVRTKPPEAFQHQRIQDRDLPRRLSFFYRDPLNDFTRSEKLQRASTPEDLANEDVAIDVDPVVLYPWDAQNACNRLFAQAIVGRDQGTIFVPPSRMDILPNDRLTFTALNWNEEDIEPDAGAIDYTTQIAGIEPFSISLEVDFETYGRCRLVDDGNGELTGYPDGVTPSTNAVDYDAGTIEFAADDDIADAARLRYEFPNGWRMRAQRVVRHRNNVTDIDVMAVAERFPIVGSPVQQNEPAYAIAVHPAQLRVEVVDASVPWLAEHAGIAYAACPLPGSVWQGAGVYTSTDGVSYTPRAVIEQPSPIGTTTSTLSGDAVPGVVDWTHTVDVTIDYGTLNDSDLETAGAGLGSNWALIGDEIVIFLRATLNEDGTYTLGGLVRGMRDTTDAMATHATGERVVVLDGLGLHNVLPGAAGVGAFDRFVLNSDVGATKWVKIVPSGGTLDDYPAQSVTFTAANARPFAPTGLVQGDLATYGYGWSPADPTYDPAAWLTDDVTIRWFRRSREAVPTFGSGSAAALLEPFERYQVDVLRNGSLVASETVGGQNSGSTATHRTFRLTLAQQTALGFASTDTAAMVVRQLGRFAVGRPTVIEWTIP